MIYPLERVGMRGYFRQQHAGIVWQWSSRQEHRQIEQHAQFSQGSSIGP
jgi:hypothetical protein